MDDLWSKDPVERADALLAVTHLITLGVQGKLIQYSNFQKKNRDDGYECSDFISIEHMITSCNLRNLS
jgi:hypothetical protein